MRAHNKEIVYVIRSPEGSITDVFDPKTNEYLRVVDTAIRIDSSESSNVEEQIKAYSKRKGVI